LAITIILTGRENMTELAKKQISPLMAMRKYFNDPRCPLDLKEIKAFKVEDPEGCAELAQLCADHYNK
jgi:hypothetical protein